MIAGNLDLEIDEGSTFIQLLTLTDPNTGEPVNLTGYTAKAQIRSTYDSPVLAEFGITLGGVLGTIQLELTATQTILDYPQPTGRTDTPRQAVWDLFIELSGTETRLLKGNVLFFPRVTQE